jgi:rhodanese-related sulfurtransferase
MGEIPERMAEVPREGNVIVICRAGVRSARVVAYLQGNGWDNVFNLDGGMRAWAATGNPVVGAGSQAGVVI